MNYLHLPARKGYHNGYMQSVDSKLVDAETLRVVLWDKRCRPSLRTVRDWQRRKILPYFKIGKGVFFDVEQVRASLGRARQ